MMNMNYITNTYLEKENRMINSELCLDTWDPRSIRSLIFLRAFNKLYNSKSDQISKNFFFYKRKAEDH